MDTNNPIVKLCIQGTQAEFAGKYAVAWALYEQAWKGASNDYEACIAAHYVARGQENPLEALYWHQEALLRANLSNDEQIRDFFPSLYLSLGEAYESTGNQTEAQRYYALAASLGFPHQDNSLKQEDSS